MIYRIIMLLIIAVYMFCPFYAIYEMNTRNDEVLSSTQVSINRKTMYEIIVYRKKVIIKNLIEKDQVEVNRNKIKSDGNDYITHCILMYEKGRKKKC